MDLTYVTNDKQVAKAAVTAGIDRIMVDLERLGKAERQFGRSLYLSDHRISDVSEIRKVTGPAKLSVRIDPLHRGTKSQIERVVQQGADLVMLPYFQSKDEVLRFLDFLAGRSTAVLLVETAGSIAILPELCELSGVAEIHIGLNDLSISLGKRSWLDPLVDGTISQICGVLRQSGLPFGFGGIASPSRRDLPLTPELVFAAQVCQGATRGWLGRTFRDLPLDRLVPQVTLLREAVRRWKMAPQSEIELLMARLKVEALKTQQNFTAPDLMLPEQTTLPVAS